MGKYDTTSSAMTSSAPTLAGGEGRFQGHGSFYESEQTPSAGEYQAQAGQSASQHQQSVSATFRSRANRFVGHDSIYAVEETPAVGAYETAPTVRATASKQASAAFKATAERFGGHGSIYQSSDASEYGAYAPPAMGFLEHKRVSSTYLSGSERFASPGGIYVVQASPGIGTYEPMHDATVKGGVVKIQQAVRRRLSRGIFAKQEAVARGVPSPGRYQQLGAKNALRRTLKASTIMNELPSSPMDAKQEITSAPSPERFSVGGTALGVYEAFAPPAVRGRLAVASGEEDKASMPVHKPEKSIPPTIAESSEGGVATTGNKDAATSAGEAATTAAGEDCSGEDLFKKLVELSSNKDVNRSDYFDETSGWDVPGLQSDLLLCHSSAATAS